MSALALQLIADNKNSHTPFLDLGNCDLQSLPETLFECNWLESLNLGHIYFEKNTENFVATQNTGGPNQFNKEALFTLKKLPFLKSLYLSHLNNLNLSFLRELKNLTALGLNQSDSDETALLSTLQDLKWLNLRWNGSAKGLLITLKNIEWLDIGYTGITYYPEIQQLKNLKHLSLHSNESDDISFLKELNQLQFLDLHRNKIKDYSVISTLTELHTLDISENYVPAYEFLKDLTNLQTLNISESKISDNSFLAELKNLRSLNMNANYQDATIFLKELTTLETLSLNQNSIANLYNLSGLKNLTYLSLRQNSIEDLDPLSNRGTLKTLILGDNNISDVSALSGLMKLRHLELERNDIKDVNELLKLFELISDKKFFLSVDNNAFLKPSDLVLEAFQNHRETIYNLIERQNDSNLQSFTLPAKVLLLGNHASGKSSLLYYILNKKPSPKTSSTHILKIEKYNAEKGDIKAIFFDFGGQDYYHGLYRAFLSSGSVQIILWNDKNNCNSITDADANKIATRNYNLDYWLGQKQYLEINKFGGIVSDTLIVQSHADEGKRYFIAYNDAAITNDFFLSLSTLPQKEKTTSEKETFECARKYFMAVLENVIVENRIERKEPEWYIKFLNFILQGDESIEAHKPILLSEILKRFYKKSIERLKDDMEQLHRKGLILYYRKDLPDIAWLNPVGLVTYINDHVLSKKLVTHSKGVLTNEQVRNLDSRIIKLLELQKVLFKKSVTNGAIQYIVPSYLPLANKDTDFELYSFIIRSTVFILKFNRFIPFGLINQMICFFGELPDIKRFWRDHVLFTLNRKLILIKLDLTVLEIRLQCTADLSEKEKSYLFYAILSLYWDIEPVLYPAYEENKFLTNEGPDKNIEKVGLENPVDRLFNTDAYCPMDLYISTDDSNYISYKAFFDISANATKINGYKLKEDRINLNESKDLALSDFQTFTRRRLKRTKKVFISYSHNDIVHRMAAQKFLVNLEREKIITIWQDGLINPGDDWNETITQKIETSDVIIMLVSQDFINSSYIYEVEMAAALKMAENRSAIIIPFLLKNCDWEQWKITPENTTESDVQKNKGIVGKFQFMPMDETDQRLQPLSNWKDREEDAWMKLVKFLRESV